MKEKFEEFYEMLKLDRKNSAWSRKNTIEYRFAELKGEISELGEAIKNNDLKNLKEEIGDSFWDLLFLAVIAEEKGYFSMENVIETSIEKLRRRKPWIFTGEDITMDEERKRWEEAKFKEKNKE
jgi:NTP pyrophosphatase (non-canonical NTP hydrolase)